MQDPNIPNTTQPPIPGVVPPAPVGVSPMTAPPSPAMPGSAPVNSMPPIPGATPQGMSVGTAVPASATPVVADPATQKPVTPTEDKPLEKKEDASKSQDKPVDASASIRQAQDKNSAQGKKVEEKRETAKSGQPEVKKADIEKVVSNWTGIPITKLTEDEGAKLLNLEKRIHQRLIDQAEAVTAVAEAVRRGRIGLAAANRPIASFIFLGPSGTGKTELAKTLAEILFGKDDAMVRLDMSEYMEKHEVAKLIGAPPGYVGYEEGGQLTEAVRAKPYSIVLLDEVEKAHPDVFNILLQLLEDGRLTDNKGNTISFKNTIVICTSNIGSALITQKLGEKDGKTQTQEELDKNFVELSTEVSAELHKFFRPELLNRFDDIVIFKPLRREDMAAIARLGIKKTGELLKEQEISIHITDKAIAQLALEGYDPVYGARPLRRLIQTSIENPIALLLIAKTFVAGDTILIDYDATKADYAFRKETAEEIAADKKNAQEAKLKNDKEMNTIDMSKMPGDKNAVKSQSNGISSNSNSMPVAPTTSSNPPGMQKTAMPNQNGNQSKPATPPMTNGNGSPSMPGVSPMPPASTGNAAPPMPPQPSNPGVMPPKPNTPTV